MVRDQRRTDREPHGDRTDEQSDRDAEVVPAPRRRRQRDDQPFDVRVEFVVLDGEAGKALARQATAMREVLQWIHDHPANVEDDGIGGDQSR